MDRIAVETMAYAAYLNASRENFDADELAMLEEDQEKARGAMERGDS